ncbi:thiamine biosynthetic bifunctional enzyme Thi4 [Infundibulicybe gibba]|nr:thiamine biosynthetic bifunctional enzyme Thi4 [Infundibulicybe gibba]
MSKGIDYTLYLVTGRGLLPPDKTYLESLELALQGGVTIVQIREKQVDTREFLQIARDSKELCDKYDVPLIINDRIDIALAVGARGVHLGQTDMSIADARRLLPPNTIIGISCNNITHVRAALQGGADYIGIGSIWRTKTKNIENPLVGVRGVGAMLQALEGSNVKAVAIGGIKSTNLLRTLYGSVSPSGRTLDGVAVVSEIFSSADPQGAAKRLLEITSAFRNTLSETVGSGPAVTIKAILEEAIQLMKAIKNLNPLVHQITNTVVATQSANVTLAVGGSPIMATAPQEMEDITKISGATLINIGTLTAESREGMLKAGYFANANKKPVVFDPVGVGASEFRRETVRELLNTWQASIIKGNPGELAAMVGSTEAESKGVDSVGSGFKDPVSFVNMLARKERCIVVMTGATDYISDGTTVVSLKNGVDMLGKITGAGCITGSILAAYCATASALSARPTRPDGQLVRGNIFQAAIAGVLVLTIAAELTLQGGRVHGPGSFLSGLIDQLSTLEPDTVRSMAKIEIH